MFNLKSVLDETIKENKWASAPVFANNMKSDSELVIFIIVDINECLTNDGKGPCEDTCTNLKGGYICGCSIPGYRLSDDNHSCQGTDIVVFTANVTVFFWPCWDTFGDNKQTFFLTSLALMNLKI